MFSKYRLIVLGVLLFAVINLIALTVSVKKKVSSVPGSPAVFRAVSPFQEIGSDIITFVRDIWIHYFSLVSTSEENAVLKEQLRIAAEKENQHRELELSNIRLRNLLDFTKTISHAVIAAEVIGKDPSPWYKTFIINKGSTDGIQKGMPVVAPEGIVGIVTDVSAYYSKVLLLIDSNFAVDALAQHSRVRGIVKGESAGRCFFQFVLRSYEIQDGDVIVSSGLDGVFPKGLTIGNVLETRQSSDIFQEVIIRPTVDFEKIEEVLVIYDNTKFESGLR